MVRLQRAARPIVGLALTLGLAVQATAADSWWNPFGSSSSSTAPRRSSSAQVSGSKSSSSSSSFPRLPMPSLPVGGLTGGSTARKPASKEPSTLDKLNSGTKAFFSKTADFLTPWDNDPSPTRRSATGSRTAKSNSSSRNSQEKGMFSWLYRKEEEQEIKTANDFLKLPRPY